MTTNFLVAGRLRERGLPVRITSRRGAPPFDRAGRGTWAKTLADVDAEDAATTGVRTR